MGFEIFIDYCLTSGTNEGEVHTRQKQFPTPSLALSIDLTPTVVAFSVVDTHLSPTFGAPPPVFLLIEPLLSPDLFYSKQIIDKADIVISGIALVELLELCTRKIPTFITERYLIFPQQSTSFPDPDTVLIAYPAPLTPAFQSPLFKESLFPSEVVPAGTAVHPAGGCQVHFVGIERFHFITAFYDTTQYLIRLSSQSIEVANINYFKIQYNHFSYSGTSFISSYNQTILSKNQSFPRYSIVSPPSTAQISS